MTLRRAALCLLGLSLLPVALAAQAPPPSPAPVAQNEAADFELDAVSTRIAFDETGRKTGEYSVTIRVHTPAGVQQAGTVVIPFRQGAMDLRVRHVRVRKPDGAVVETPLTPFFDLPAPITQAAPTYSDLFFRHINVQAVQPGDVLEYAWEADEPSMIPGHFWLADAIDAEPFSGGRVVEVSWPSTMRPIVKNGRHTPEVTTDAGRTTYRWVSGEAKPTDDDDDDPQDAVVRVTSFKGWDEVGAAIRELWRARAEVTPEIRAKALELTKDLSTNDEKARALYRFVSTNIRYVAVAFGLGRIQPNSAATVLANGYGDCKDKHILLESLLRAVDIDATPVLIGPGVEIDRDVPSFDMFSHVITLIERGLPAPVWLDTTLEVAPFGFLIGTERDATVLVVPERGESRLMTTPEVPARINALRTETTGRVSEDGQLQATVREEATGDIEVVLRAAFRSAGRQQWEQIVRALPLSRMRAGTIADIVVTPPEDTDAPFRVDYRYTVDGFADWSNSTFSPPVPLDVPKSPDAAAADKPVEVELAGMLTSVARIELPENVEVRRDSSPPVDLSRAFGQYRFAWSVDGRVVAIERQLMSDVKEIPASEIDDYRAFLASVRDAPFTLRVRRIAPWAWNEDLTIEWYDGASPATQTALGAAADLGRRGDHQAAIAAVRRILETEPESDAAWQMLAWAQLESGDTARGFETLKRRAPAATSPALLKYYASRLSAHGRRDEAVDVLRMGRERFADDRDFPVYLGESLVARGRAAEALDVLLPVADQQERSGRYHVALGRAYLATKNERAAIASFLRSAEVDDNADLLNAVALELGHSGLALDDAVRLAARSVKLTAEQINQMQVETAGAEQMRIVASLASKWDTLGWIHLERGDAPAAVRYLEAAWGLSQQSSIASHLSAAYAAARDTAGAERHTALTDAALERTRTFSLAADLRVDAPIDVLLLVGADGRVRDVRFLNTTARGSALTDALRSVVVPWTPPDGDLTQVIRRGRVSCAQQTSACALVLRTTADAVVAFPR